MGLFDVIENLTKKNIDNILKQAERDLRTASDSAVLSKLADAREKMDSEYGYEVYEVVYREASRRGLV